MTEEPFRPENGGELGPDALDVEQHRRRRSRGGTFRGKQSIPLGLHRLDLIEQQFKSIELTANLPLQMIRQRMPITGLELFQPLPSIAAERLVSGYPWENSSPLIRLT